MTPYPHINLEILEGMRRYFSSFPEFPIRLLTKIHRATIIELIKQNQLYGMIGSFLSDKWLDDPAFKNIKLINIGQESEILYHSTFAVDDYQIGASAAEHLLSSHYDTYACICQRANRSSSLRQQGFAETLLLAKEIIPLKLDKQGLYAITYWKEWIRTWSSPPAIFCTQDSLAIQFFHVAQEEGKQWGKDYLLLGVGNEIESLAHIPLSSIPIPYAHIAYKASEHLHKEIQENACYCTQHLFPAHKPLIRASTILENSPDALIMKALVIMENHKHTYLNLETIAQYCHVSKRTLEQKFKLFLQTSPAREYKRIRINYIAHLLQTTTTSIEDIALRSGWSTASALIHSFTQSKGISPARYRASFSPIKINEDTALLKNTNP